MDSLSEGNTYNLAINEENRSNTSVVLVKLTDSMLKSIEECQENGGPNPKIQFDEHSGVIQFTTDNGIEKYNFSLSDMGGKENGDWNNLPKRNVECVRQDKNGSLESLGSMTMKMQIQAKEDSYENTRFKVAAAEKEQKQYCTKEIKPSGSRIGHQIRVNQPKNAVAPSNSRSVLLAKSIGHVKPKNNVGISFNSPSVSSAKCDSNPSARPVSTASAKPVTTPSAKTVSIPSTSPATNPSAKLATIPSMSPGSRSSIIQRKENLKSKVQRRPLRERMVHLLAVRPHKKPEIMTKIQTEGVNDKDKNNLSVILAKVSIIKQNTYYLSDGFWSEVQDNWKFYSPEDAETVRKKFN